ncbi:hypothetical protein AB0F49_30795 [Micromonospora ureilytica]
MDLLGEYDTAPVALSASLWSHLTAARQDRTWAPPDTSYRRFLGWLA